MNIKVGETSSGFLGINLGGKEYDVGSFINSLLSLLEETNPSKLVTICDPSLRKSLEEMELIYTSPNGDSYARNFSMIRSLRQHLEKAYSIFLEKRGLSDEIIN